MLLELARDVPCEFDLESVKQMIVYDPYIKKHERRINAWHTLFGKKSVRRVTELLMSVQRCKCRKAFRRRITYLYLQVYAHKRRRVTRDRSPQRSRHLQYSH